MSINEHDFNKHHAVQLAVAALAKTPEGVIPTAESINSMVSDIYITLVALSPDSVAKLAQEPAVPIKKSVTDDYIVCLEDGKKLKMLKRHLRTSFGMTPDEYRTKWGLPIDYPMTAPNYAKKRSELAKEIGLGLEIMSWMAKLLDVMPTFVVPTDEVWDKIKEVEAQGTHRIASVSTGDAINVPEGMARLTFAPHSAFKEKKDD